MTSSHNLVELYSRLETVLGGLLKDLSPALIIKQNGGYPLLLLETSSDFVGFAIVGDSPEFEYSTAYETFKKLYRENHSTLKELNLSFVTCRLDTSVSLDAFFGSIEADLYFCRKYVVSFSNNLSELEQMLMCLPFLPVPEGRPGGLFRPLSAQTFLQSLNVPAKQARKVVVSGECSAERLVSEWIAQEKLPSTLRSSKEFNIQSDIQLAEHTRIKNIEINAFRAYRTKQKFDVDADVIVLFGRNGLGKTSFFDAIDYACTGRIGRLCRQRINQKSFIDVARHLNSAAQEGYVSLQVSQGAKTQILTRRVDDWSSALLGTEVKERVDVLQFLTSAQRNQEKRRVSNLERLFRATHLFSQTDPELLSDFQKNSTLSHDLVSRMLALDDYASGRAKTTEVLALLDKSIAQKNQEIGILKIQAAEIQSQRGALPELEDSVQVGKQLKDLSLELVKDLQTLFSMTIDDTEPNPEVAREWRAMAESFLTEAKEYFRLLQYTESEFPQFAKNQPELKHRTDELSKLEDEIREQAAEHAQLNAAKMKLTQKFEQSLITVAELELQLSGFSKLSEYQEMSRKTGNFLQSWKSELQRVTDDAEITIRELHPLLPVAESLSIRVAEVRDEIQALSQQTQAIVALQYGVTSWTQDLEQVVNLQQTISSEQAVLKTLIAQVDELAARLVKKENKLAMDEEENNNLTTNQLKLTRLLDEIEEHVDESVCPTCGIDHKTTAHLVGRIRAQKKARPTHVETFVKSLGVLRREVKQDRENLATWSREKANKINEQKELAGKLAVKSDSIKAFEKAVEEAGFSVHQQLGEILLSKMAENNTVRQSSRDVLSNLETELRSVAQQISGLEQKQENHKIARERANVAILPLEKQRVSIKGKVEALGLSLDLEPAELIAQTESVVSSKAQAAEKVKQLAQQIEELTQSGLQKDNQFLEVKSRVEILRHEIIRLEEELIHFKERIAVVFDGNSPVLESIIKKKTLAEERVGHIEALRRRCLNFERILDSTHRSVLSAELRVKAQSLEKEILILVEGIEQAATGKKWFTDLKDALDMQSSSAVANHVDAFGPLTSLIQTRLRAVYGFGDINLIAKKSEILVEVGWASEHLRPGDYFSDSQKQILMLSLFLANRLTQTWSGFAPIFMDDPVTHFDDLNAFGFVELIRGFVNNSPGQKQFFISTCEDRLFELMQKKFRNLTGGAKFFRFEGIGHDGPIISEQ